jgi:hypothetical protein
LFSEVFILDVMLAGTAMALSYTQNSPTSNVGDVVVVTEGAIAVFADAPLAPTTSTAVPPLTAIIAAVQVSQLYPPAHTNVSDPVAIRVNVRHVPYALYDGSSFPRSVQPAGAVPSEPDLLSILFHICTTRTSPTAVPTGAASVNPLSKKKPVIVVVDEAERKAGPVATSTKPEETIPKILGT